MDGSKESLALEREFGLTAVPINRANSLFPGRNDRGGLMLCGYEWGWSRKDQEGLEAGTLPPIVDVDAAPPHTFSDKTPRFGAQCWRWPYDRRIREWFEVWGHPLVSNGLGGRFEQSVLQTNWCNTQANSIVGSFSKKLLDPPQVNNFLWHVAVLRPRLILFFGAVLLRALQAHSVMPTVQRLLGHGDSPRWQKGAGPGIRFAVGFQELEHARIVGLPHPSSSRGLSTKYIASFAPEISERIAWFKAKADGGELPVRGEAD